VSSTKIFWSWFWTFCTSSLSVVGLSDEPVEPVEGAPWRPAVSRVLDDSVSSRHVAFMYMSRFSMRNAASSSMMNVVSSSPPAMPSRPRRAMNPAQQMRISQNRSWSRWPTGLLTICCW
jgi:hypothetical protein